MSKPGEARVFLSEGFRWDEQDAYLIDIDGTLLRHKDRVHFDAFFESVRGVMGRDLVLDGVILAGNTDPGILRDAFRKAKVEDAVWRPQREAVLQAMCAKVVERRQHLQPMIMPGVEATLAHLEENGALLGVATGNLEEIGWLKIENAGLRSWFSFGGFSDRFEKRADMIAHADEQARAILRSEGKGAAKNREFTVCVVGDTPFDIEAARANGLPTVAVATGRYDFDALMEHHPAACATTLAALLKATPGPTAPPAKEATENA
ncbi:MAG TPA: HAD hydrolase-like protein [Acidobacteriaceae bacterium]|jgi:phosphoglycolate phosphatase-like HAD superfamily hydrolase|nr:HAD hydrolase-like protein [Acidobacteriaceae bacterium]